VVLACHHLRGTGRRRRCGRRTTVRGRRGGRASAGAERGVARGEAGGAPALELGHDLRARLLLLRRAAAAARDEAGRAGPGLAASVLGEDRGEGAAGRGGGGGVRRGGRGRGRTGLDRHGSPDGDGDGDAALRGALSLGDGRKEVKGIWGKPATWPRRRRWRRREQGAGLFRAGGIIPFE
jgi:hypothetical protein